MKSSMVKTFLLSVLIIFIIQGFSQNKNAAVISSDNLHILYLGIDNPVSVAVPEMRSEELIVTVTNGTITGSNGKYIVQPANIPESIIKVSVKDDSGEIRQISCDTFRVLRLPVPKACIGTTCGTNLYLKKDELLRNPEINVSWNVPLDLSFDIVSFSFTYIKDKDVAIIPVKGGRFTQEIIDAIEGMEGLSKIYIEDIMVLGPDQVRRKLDSIAIKLDCD